MSNNTDKWYDKLSNEFAEYKGFIIKISALTLHSNHNYSGDGGEMLLIDELIQIGLSVLIGFSIIKIILKIWNEVKAQNNQKIFINLVLIGIGFYLIKHFTNIF